MITELSKEKKLKVAQEIQSVFKEQNTKNTEKLKMLENIVLRVTTEQKQAYKQLSKETKTPLSKIIRTSLQRMIIRRVEEKQSPSPDEVKANFKKFQKKLGLIK